VPGFFCRLETVVEQRNRFADMLGCDGFVAFRVAQVVGKRGDLLFGIAIANPGIAFAQKDVVLPHVYQPVVGAGNDQQLVRWNGRNGIGIGGQLVRDDRQSRRTERGAIFREPSLVSQLGDATRMSGQRLFTRWKNLLQFVEILPQLGANQLQGGLRICALVTVIYPLFHKEGQNYAQENGSGFREQAAKVETAITDGIGQ